VTNPLTSARPRWVAMTTVVICDDRPRVRAALTRRVGALPTVTDIDCVTDAVELLATFAARPPGLVFIGLHRGKTGGTDAADELLHRYPSAAVIVFGAAADTPRLTAAVARGARGVMLWGPDQPDRTPARPGPFNAGRPAAARDPAAGGGRPTDRELQILRGFSQGFTHGAIGRELALSEDTIKAHSRRLLHKLGARDRAHAVALGIRDGLVA
jgi:DNA-binding NarL/FixJ family response regulator